VKVLFLYVNSTKSLDLPLGIAYLSASLKEHGHKTGLLDLTWNLTDEEIIRKMKGYDILAISCTTLEYQNSLRIARIWKHNFGLPIIMGGCKATFEPEIASKNPLIDGVCIGEGEEAIVEWVQRYEQWLEIPRHVKNFYPNPLRPLIENLDTLPFPDRSIFDIKQIVNKYPGTTFLTCYDEETEVLTSDGWKYFREITYDDKIATLDSEGFLEYQKPIEIISSDYKGDLYDIKSKAIDLCITPNHNVYIRVVQRPRPQRHRIYGNFKLVPISQIAHLTALEFKRDMKWRGIDQEFFELRDTYNLNYRERKQKSKFRMEDWLEFLGYYLAEGSATRASNNRYIVKISQTKDKSPEVYHKMNACIERLGFNYYEHAEYFAISNKQLWCYLSPLGKSYEKYIPREFLTLPSSKLKILLNALIDGDGCRQGTTDVYFTTSRQLVDDVQELAIKAGYCATTSLHNAQRSGSGMIKDREGKMRRIFTKHQCYAIIISTKQATPAINRTGEKRNVSKIFYHGKVYCVNVPNHIIYIRRKGKTVWCGNSRGCPFTCSMCANHYLQKLYHGLGKYTRFRSIDNLFSEISEVDEKYKIQTVFFIDDTFTINHKWREELCRRYPKEVGLPFMFMGRCNTVTKDLIFKLKQAGCIYIGYGVESGNEYIRNKLLRHGMTEEQIINAFKWTHEAGIKTASYNMIGIPFEDRAKIFETIELNKKIKPNIIQTTLLYPFPKTDIHELCRKNGLLREDDAPELDEYYTGSIIKIPNMTSKQLYALELAIPFYVYLPKFLWFFVRLLEWVLSKSPNKIFRFILSIFKVKVMERNFWKGFR